MSFLSALSSFAGQAQQPVTDQHAAVAQAALEHAQQQPGGLAGMLDGFRQNGMSQHVDSWLGSQPNMPIEGNQVEQGLGTSAIDSIAQRAGISPSTAKAALAFALPMLISHMSQGTGQLPQQAGSSSGLAGIAASLFSRVL